jgi:Cdc6-like AAA superfamily ATPase
LRLGRTRGKPKPKERPLLLDGDPAFSIPASVQSPRAATPAAEAAFPRFQVTAHDQVDPRNTSDQAVQRIRLRSAFTPAQPVADQRLFAGRREILTMLIRSIEDERLHVILYGDRGIGKTSLLHVMAQAARDARYVVAYVSCGASSSFDETFRTVATDIPLMFHRDYGPTSPGAERGDTFAKLLDETPVSARHASDLCAKVIDTRVLVVLDEFDRCESTEFRRDIAEFLKNLSDRSVRVQLVIAGVAANLGELIQDRATINRNILAIEAPRMAVEEIRDLVAKGERASGVAFDEAARQSISEIANGLPYSASLLSHHAGLAALSNGRVVVHSNDVLEALSLAIVEVHGRLSRRAQFQVRALLNDDKLNLLGPLAGHAQFSGGAFSNEDINSTYPGAVAAERCRALVNRLASERSLIEAVTDEFGSHYRFLDENVAPYLWFSSARLAFTAQQAADQPARDQALARQS